MFSLGFSNFLKQFFFNIKDLFIVLKCVITSILSLYSRILLTFSRWLHSSNFKSVNFTNFDIPLNTALSFLLRNWHNLLVQKLLVWGTQYLKSPKYNFFRVLTSFLWFRPNVHSHYSFLGVTLSPLPLHSHKIDLLRQKFSDHSLNMTKPS